MPLVLLCAMRMAWAALCSGPDAVWVQMSAIQECMVALQIYQLEAIPLLVPRIGKMAAAFKESFVLICMQDTATTLQPLSSR